MAKHKIVKLCGRDVRLCYCAATEVGFEKMTDKNISDIDFQRESDMMHLALAAIVAAYVGEEPPVKGDDLMYDARPAELIGMYKALMEARAEWYELPGFVAEDMKREAEESDAKNA